MRIYKNRLDIRDIIFILMTYLYKQIIFFF